MNSMLLWLSIPLILLLIVIIYYIWPKKRSCVKEKFQNQYDEDTPPINLNVTVSPTLLNSARNVLSNITNNTDISGYGIPASETSSNCIIIQNQLQNYNSELQRHRNEGNWNHTHAIRSYIDIINKELIASGCQTN